MNYQIYKWNKKCMYCIILVCLCNFMLFCCRYILDPLGLACGLKKKFMYSVQRNKILQDVYNKSSAPKHEIIVVSMLIVKLGFNPFTHTEFITDLFSSIENKESCLPTFWNSHGGACSKFQRHFKHIYILLIC